MRLINKLAWILLFALILCKMIGWVAIEWLPIIIFGGVLVALDIIAFIFIIVIAAIISYADQKDK